MYELKNVTKTYKKVSALNAIDLQINKGDVIGILGPNGSGKSTLIRIMAGLIPCNTGEVSLNGKAPSSETKAYVSYLSDTNYLPKGEKIKEIVDFYDYFYDDFDRSEFMEKAKDLELDEYMKTKVKSLSLGMVQKLRLALTMSRKAELYLLDEPLGGIDVLAREDVLDTLITSMDDQATMIITTHLISEIERILTRTVFIYNGEILGDYDCEELRFSENTSVEDKYKEVFRNAKNS